MLKGSLKPKTVTKNDLATMTAVCCNTDQKKEKELERLCVNYLAPLPS